MTTPLCRSDYYADTRRPRDRGARLLECGLPAEHDGDHDEMIDGEAGVVTWPRRVPEPRTWTMPARPGPGVTRLQDAAGNRYVRADDGCWVNGSRHLVWAGLLSERGPLTDATHEADEAEATQ